MKPGILKLAAGIVVAATACNAQDLAETHFGPGAVHRGDCFVRSYSRAHLAQHPDQRVTMISLAPVPLAAPSGQVLITVGVMLRGIDGYFFSSFAYCDPQGPKFACAMEGDAGLFTLTSDGPEALLLTVGAFGMTFEGDTDVFTLKSDSGDDRVFLIPNVPSGLCN